MSFSSRLAISVLTGFAFAGVAQPVPADVPAAAPAAAPQSNGANLLVPKGTAIVVQTVAPIDSRTAYVGQSLAFTVTNDVIMNGELVAKAGDRAFGTVEDSVNGRKVHAGTVGAVAGPVGAAAGAAVNKAASKGANLRISINRLTTFCGSSIPLAFVRSEYHRPKRLQKMTPVQISSGQMYRTSVAADYRTCARPTASAPAPIPAAALPADPG